MSYTIELLQRVERAGNRLPHPTLLFIGLSALVALISVLGDLLHWQGVHPGTGQPITVNNLLQGDSLATLLLSMIRNFTEFGPVGTVLVVMLGLGVAERAGLLSNLLERLLRWLPRRWLGFGVALIGVLSSLAVDAGYVVVIPLAGLLFAQAGRSPLAGIACAFAGVSAGFSANLVVGPLDAMLAGISSDAAQLVNARAVSISDNYYFMALSTPWVALLIALVCQRVTEPLLGDCAPAAEPVSATATAPVALWPMLLPLAAGTALLTLPSGAPLHGRVAQALVPLIGLWSGLLGYYYARRAGLWQSGRDAVVAMEQTLASLSGYLVLMFFAAQFVAWFKLSNLGLLLAVAGAQWLQQLALSAPLLLMLVMLLVALTNLLIGSASAKWALLAPIVIPMLALLGIDPASTQVAYRVGDSVTNIITPLMPYYAMVLAFCQRHQPQTGVGTMLAMMLPYSVVLLLGWGGLLLLWLSAGWPLGPQ